MRSPRLVVYLLIPTSNHNHTLYEDIVLLLYIFWFLHQTTTWWFRRVYCSGCISFDSYIKPQRNQLLSVSDYVVYLLIPTSNHNLFCYAFYWWWLYIFWFLHQTTTDTLPIAQPLCCISFDSYIKPQPILPRFVWRCSCISFDSYIKPQLKLKCCHQGAVVYLLIPTSNHNL